MKNSVYSNKHKELFSESYKKYFRKKDGAKVVKSRGSYKISDYLNLDLSIHRNKNVNAFCLNDLDSALHKIRDKENEFSIIDEGLIATYPSEKVIRHYKKYFQKIVSPRLVNAVFPGTTSRICDFKNLSDEREQISPLLMICVPAEDDKDVIRLVKCLTDEFVKSGYYMTSYDINDISNEDFQLVYIQFEAKYTNMLVEFEQTLYHVAPLKFLDKILKNGLVPYSKSKNFKYEPRVYLFNKCPKQQIYDYGVFKANELNDNGFCVFKLKKDSLINDQIFINGHQRFYLDPSFSISETTDQTAIFTYGNIPLRLLDRQYVIVSVEDDVIISEHIEFF